MTEKPRTYTATPKDVAKVYGVSYRTVHRWAERGQVPHRATPSGPRFNLEELEARFTREPEPAAV